MPLLVDMWRSRLVLMPKDAEVWGEILSVRYLVAPPPRDPSTWLKFGNLCRKSGRGALGRKILFEILGTDPASVPSIELPTKPAVAYTYFKVKKRPRATPPPRGLLLPSSHAVPSARARRCCGLKAAERKRSHSWIALSTTRDPHRTVSSLRRRGGGLGSGNAQRTSLSALTMWGLSCRACVPADR